MSLKRVQRPEDIVDVTAIALRANTTPGTVHSWRNRHSDFPAPIVTLAIGPIWSWFHVEQWLAHRKGAR